MKEFFAGLSIFVLLLILIIGIGWVLEGNNFFLYQFFAPKYAAVQRQTFEQTKSYNQGMIQELQNMQFEYEKSTPAQQDALASIILHRAADYDEDKLPPDLHAFIEKLKDKQNNPNLNDSVKNL